MYKALKDEKIIAINDTDNFPCLVCDEVVEDTEHTVEDYIHCDGEFVLTTDEKAIALDNKTKVAEARKYLQETDYIWNVIREGDAIEEHYVDVIAKRKEARELIRSLENG
ncbi:MAG: hypothetical protein KBT03_09615 [Bacteroidales bacterium]|nr:hypothetical protein [Candidatus Scybalousia scybalohippi]